MDGRSSKRKPKPITHLDISTADGPRPAKMIAQGQHLFVHAAYRWRGDKQRSLLTVTHKASGIAILTELEPAAAALALTLLDDLPWADDLDNLPVDLPDRIAAFVALSAVSFSGALPLPLQRRVAWGDGEGGS